MKKLDRYILKKLFSTFLFVVLILMLIICVIDFTEKNDDFIRSQVSRAEILRYYGAFLPWLSSLITPITVFIATVFVTSKMAQQTEIIAIMAGGISYRRIMIPYFVFAVVISLLSFYLNGYVIPDANKYRVDFELENLKKPFQNLDRNIHFKVAEESYVYLNRYNNVNNIGYTVTLERFDGYELKEKISARRILWDSVQSKWMLDNWQKRTLEENREIIEEGVKLDTAINMVPADFDNKEMRETTLTMSELESYIDLQLSRGAADVEIFRMEKHIRYAQPFAVLILTFIGLVVSTRKSRGGVGMQIAIGFMISFVFIIFVMLGRAIAEAGTMNTMLAVWIPNLVFSGVSALLYFVIPK